MSNMMMLIGVLAAQGDDKGYPVFTYTGTYELIEDTDTDWRIKFLTSGKLTFKSLGNAKNGIDIFLVGGGGAAGHGGYDANYDSEWGYPNGGGGGYNTLAEAAPEKGVEYEIVVGAGGAKSTANGGKGGNGGTSSAFGSTAGGGGGGSWSNYTTHNKAGSGGSGGGGYHGAGGSNGANGGGDGGGTGAGFSCYEFRETASGVLYCGGGYGAATKSVAVAAGGGGAFEGNGGVNTGGGGGGGWNGKISGGAGGSGIVIIRNRRAS